MSRIPERNRRYKWVGALTKNISYIITRKDFPIHLNNKNDANQYFAGVINGDVSEHYLRELGFSDNHIYFTSQSKSLIQMLIHRRVDVVVDNWPNFKSTVQNLSLNIDQFRITGVANSGDVSFAYSADTPDWIIEKFQQKFDKLDHDGVIDDIRKRYPIEAEPIISP